MIHVCFALYDKTGRYSKFTGTAMTSIFENTASEVTVHILHDDTLPADNRDKFIYIAGRYGQHVKFYNVETLCADKLAKMVELVPAVKTARVSVGAFYRLLAPQVLPRDIEKIIYLDADIIVNLDIRELWNIELADKPLAAAPEAEIDYLGHPTNSKQKYLIVSNLVGYDDYFNSGSIVLNLEYLRRAEELLMSGIKWRGEHPQCNWFDQDILNYLFAKDYLKLPEKFDVFINVERVRHPNKTRAAIYHYVVNCLELNTDDIFNRLWMEYFMRTPFFDADTIGRLYAGFRNVHVGLKNSLAQVSAMMSGKTRAFFVASVNVNMIRQIFYIHPDEEIITADSQASFQKLLNIMNASRGKKIFFICVPKFPFGALTQAGFAAGKDFVNGFDFLSEAHGVPLNSYPLIKAM